MRKKIIIAIFLFVLINIGIKINNVQAEGFNFPNQIGPISRTSQAAFPTANGINYYGQTYKYDVYDNESYIFKTSALNENDAKNKTIQALSAFEDLQIYDISKN